MVSPKARIMKDVLWAVVIAGIVASILRFALGLGYTTGLNDSTPWGLWIAFKLGFVAMAGGGFTLAGMVYIFHLETFRPLLRRAILLALLGYGSFIVSLIFDLGLPWHIYMPILNWQHHSVMFEIAWCVMLYFTVLALEFGPVILEHPWFNRPIFHTIVHLLHKATIPIVIAGIVLSTLHQSSLGSLFLIMPHRVHPLWYTPLIPYLFFTSAIAAGLMALVVESFIAEAFFGRGLHQALLTRVAKIAGWVLVLYLGLRIAGAAASGALPAALDGSWQSILFGAEILLGGVLPAVLLQIPGVRERREGLLTCALLVVGGVLTQRMSLSMITMWRPEGAGYIPSFLEVIIAFAIPAAAGLIYFLFMENLAVVDETLPVQPGDHFARPVFHPTMLTLEDNQWQGTLIRRTSLGVVIIALTVAALPSGIVSGEQMPQTPVKAATGWQIMKISSFRPGYQVMFPHEDHQERLLEQYDSESAACSVCHHMNKPEDEGTACSECHRDHILPTSIFNHTYHQTLHPGSQGCSECHLDEHTSSSVVACVECHETMAPEPGESAYNALAPGYKDIMHENCLECHKQEAEKQNIPELGQCATCHSVQFPLDQTTVFLSK